MSEQEIEKKIKELKAQKVKLAEKAKVDAEKARSERMKLVTAAMTLFKVKTPVELITAIKTASKVKGNRTKITDEMRAEVVKLLKTGDMTAAMIAGQVKISLPSVNSIKKANGLTKPRTEAPVAAK